MNFRLTTFFFVVVVVLFAALLVVVLLDEGKDKEAGGLVDTFLRAGLTEKDIDQVELIRTEPGEEHLTFIKQGNGQWQQAPAGRVDGATVDGVVRAIFRAKPIQYKELTDNLTLHGLDKPTFKVVLKAGAGADREVTINFGLSVIGDPAVTFVTTSTSKRPIAIRRTDLAPVFRENTPGLAGPAWETAKWLPEYRPRRLLMPLAEVQAVKLGVDGKELALNRDRASGVWKFVAPAAYGEADNLGDSAPQTSTAPFTGMSPLLDFLTSLQAGPEDYVDKPGDDMKKYGLADGDPSRFRIELKGPAGETEVLYLGKTVEENGKPVVPTRVYAQRAGDPAVIKLNTDRTGSLRQTIANPSELRNKDVLSETSRTVADAIDITVGAQTVKLRRATTALGDRWVVYGDAGKEPVEAKPGEVEALLTTLSRPRAAREILPTPNDAAFVDTEKKATVKVWLGATEAQKVDPPKLPPEPKLKDGAKFIELIFGKREGDAVLVRKVVDGQKTDLKLADSVIAQVTKSRLDFLDPKLKSFNTQLVTKLTFNRGTETVSLARPTPAAAWTFESPPAMKGKTADADTVSGLVGLLASLAADRVLSEAPSPKDLQDFNLAPAPRMTATLTINDATDKERVYHFGADVKDTALVYAQQVGRPFVVTAPREVLNRFLTDDLRDRTVYKLAPANMTRVTIEGWSALNKQLNGKQDRMKYVLEKKAGAWVGTEPAGFSLDPEKVPGLLAALATPKAGKYQPGKPEHGTDPATNADAMVFTIVSEGGLSVLSVQLVLGKPTEGGKVFAASNVMPGETFTLDPTEIKQFTETPAALQKAK